MQNLKETIVSALFTATAVTTIVGQRIYYFYPPTFNELPCISYKEENNYGTMFADNVESGSEIRLTFDLWGKSSITALSMILDNLMVIYEFDRTMKREIYEEDTNIYHIIQTYSKDTVDEDYVGPLWPLAGYTPMLINGGDPDTVYGVDDVVEGGGVV